MSSPGDWEIQEAKMFSQKSNEFASPLQIFEKCMDDSWVVQ